jgi:hypothetical protein
MWRASYRNEAGALQVDPTLARSTAPPPINESDGTKGVSFKLERRQLCHPSGRTAGRKTCRVARAILTKLRFNADGMGDHDRVEGELGRVVLHRGVQGRL